MKIRFYLLFALVLINFPLLVYPCGCRDISVAEGVTSSDIVFKGTVLSVIKTSNYEDVVLKIDTKGLDDMVKQMKSYPPLYYVTVKVESIYKEKPDTDTIKILTPVSGASCGYRHFEKGKSYIIYANQEDSFSKWKLPTKPIIYVQPNLYWTNHCTRTTYWYKDEENEILATIKN